MWYFLVCYQFVIDSAQKSEYSKMSDRGYHVSRAGLTTRHLESLGNLTAYLLGLLTVQVIKIYKNRMKKRISDNTSCF